MKKFKMTELQNTYRLGMDESVFLGGNCPFIYIRTHISDFEPERFREALIKVTENNILLHCTLSESGEWHEKAADADIVYLDAADADSICREKADDLLSSGLRAYVVRQGGGADVHLKFSGLAVDGMSIDIFLSQLNKAYSGEELPVTADFSEYVRRLEEYRSSEDISFIKEAFRDREWDDFSLPVRQDPYSASGLKNSCIRRTIGSELYGQAGRLADKLGVTVFTLLMTVYSKVISRFSGARRFVMNIPCSARVRDIQGINDSVGLFSNYACIPVDVTAGLSVGELAKRSIAGMEILKRSRFVPGNRTTQLAGLPSGNYSSNVIFTMLPFSDNCGDFAMDDWRILTNQAVIEAHVLTLGGVPSICINYPDELFEAKAVEDIADMFVSGIKAAVASDGAVSTLPLTSETVEVIDKVNATELEIPEMTLCSVMLEAFEKYSDKTACIYMDREYTYADMYRMAAALGKLTGGGRGVTTLFLPKCPEQFAAAYSVLLTGGAYLPADISYTSLELSYCLEKTKSETIITVRSLADKIPKGYSGKIIFADEADLTEWEDFTPVLPGPDDLCIIINTSGTTGKPKSVMLSNRNVVNCLYCTPDFSGASEGDRLIALTNYCHDMAIFDMVGLFFYGGCTVIPDEQQAREPLKWVGMLKKYRISLWESVPSFMEMLMTELETQCIRETFTDMKCIMHGGEHLRQGVASFIRSTFPNAVLYNVGGPSESTIWNIRHLVTDEDIKSGTIPYGSPMPNMKYHVFNDDFEECPFGVSGALYCSGTGISQGYMGAPDETAKKFKERGGVVFYDTGDLGIRRRDGIIMILGRNDFQVKIHGKRIELSGIEHILEEHESVIRASAVYSEKAGKLGAVYIASGDVTSTELTAYMKERCAGYMIPKVFVRTEQIPLTHNGKADRKALEEMILNSAAKPSDEKKQSPQTGSLRDEILGLFEEELDCDIDDEDVNFYEIGGDSLTAVRIAAKLRHMTGRDISVFNMINSDTIGTFLDELLD